jgi:hypothetical protein
MAPKLVVSVAALTLAGCGGGPDPCLGLKKGDRIKVVTIASEYSPATECAGQLGIVPGGEMVATIRGFGGGGDQQDCVAAQADVEAESGWTWTFRGPSTDDADISGWYDASYGNCRGSILMRLSAPSIPSPSWDPVSAPGSAPADIDIFYTEKDDRTDPTCPGECPATYGVQVSR